MNIRPGYVTAPGYRDDQGPKVRPKPNNNGIELPPEEKKKRELNEQLIKGMVNACFWQMHRLEQLRK